MKLSVLLLILDRLQGGVITGIEVRAITRVENRILYNRYHFSHVHAQYTSCVGLQLCEHVQCRFNDKLTLSEGDQMFPMTTGSQNKCLFDYLFLVWKPGMCKARLNFSLYNDTCTCILTGQSYLDFCKEGLPNDGLISLSNSVNLADAPRLAEISVTHFQTPALKLAKVLNGKLLLCKVFTKQSKEIKDQL